MNSYLSGEVITYDNAYYSRKLRRKIEMDMIALWKDCPDIKDILHLGRLALLPYSLHQGTELLFYLFGKLELNYRKNSASCTVVELYGGDTDVDTVIPHANYQLIKEAK